MGELGHPNDTGVQYKKNGGFLADLKNYCFSGLKCDTLVIHDELYHWKDMAISMVKIC
jgi:hypothetical protein